MCARAGQRFLSSSSCVSQRTIEQSRDSGRSRRRGPDAQRLPPPHLPLSRAWHSGPVSRVVVAWRQRTGGSRWRVCRRVRSAAGGTMRGAELRATRARAHANHRFAGTRGGGDIPGHADSIPLGRHFDNRLVAWRSCARNSVQRATVVVIVEQRSIQTRGSLTHGPRRRRRRRRAPAPRRRASAQQKPIAPAYIRVAVVVPSLTPPTPTNTRRYTLCVYIYIHNSAATTITDRCSIDWPTLPDNASVVVIVVVDVTSAVAPPSHPHSHPLTRTNCSALRYFRPPRRQHAGGARPTPQPPHASWTNCSSGRGRTTTAVQVVSMDFSSPPLMLPPVRKGTTAKICPPYMLLLHIVL